MVFINQLNGDMKMMGDDHNMVVPLKMGNHPSLVWKSQCAKVLLLMRQNFDFAVEITKTNGSSNPKLPLDFSLGILGNTWEY